MKGLFALVLSIMLCCHTASATILPPDDIYEEFKAWTGLECIPAVVLCESLTILDERGDQGGQRVGELTYTGNNIPVIESWDGYAKIYYEDGTKTGWVRNDYLMLKPAWYVCDEAMQVYAYPDVMAPAVAWLEAGTRLPVLTEYDDGQSISGWVCVSLRGASGWIRKTPNDTAGETWFRPAMLESIVNAKMILTEEIIELADENALAQLAELLIHTRDEGGMVAGCPFTALLQLKLENGQKVELQIATDSCCVYRVDGRDYSYARHLWDEDKGSPSNEKLFELFGVNVQDFWAK